MITAFVFPGQGSQTIGMGKALAEAFSASREVFEEVDSALGLKLSEIIWEGDIADLTLTENAQPAIMATSMAVIAALRAEGVTAESIDFVAGHSLGEYSALCAAEAITLADTAKLLRIRGKAMQAAVPVGEGAMAALLGVDFTTAQAIASEAAQGEVCQVANDNDPGQVVISGQKTAIERALDIAKTHGAKRAILLPVSAPFHCALMHPAADAMAEALDEIEITAPKSPLIANVRASSVTNPERIKTLLIEQVTGVVRWRESMIWLDGAEVEHYFEIGQGKALSGMIKRSIGYKDISNVIDPVDIQSTVAQILKES